MAEEDRQRSLAQASGSPTKMLERETSILEDDESDQGTMKTENQGISSKLTVLTKH